jgi:hypothetical protein
MPKPRLRKKQPDTPRFQFRREWLLYLVLIFVVSFGVRVYGALHVGFDLDGPGTFQVINYDEGGACKGKLGTLPYPSFLGTQIIALASLFGYPPPRELLHRTPPLSPAETMRGKAYCESRPLIVMGRLYSVITGALTVTLVALLGLMMWPSRPRIAWTAAVVLGLSSFHVAESHTATVDAPQVFFLVLFTATLAYGLVTDKKWPLVISPALLACVVLTKYYFFAVAAYVAFLPGWRTMRRPLRYALWGLPLLALVVILQWDNIRSNMLSWVWYALHGEPLSRFGTGYGNIGLWRRWIRNGTNLLTLHVVALGIPACLFLWRGLRRAIEQRSGHELWLLHVPAIVFAIYLALVAPVTYYRHYLPLLPTLTLLAAYGFWESRWSSKRAVVVAFLLYPLLLTLDSEYNYRFDPRRELRQWSEAHPAAVSFATFYVVPPTRTGRYALFDMGAYLRDGVVYLQQADYLILSENWYDTSFPNELNGPIAWKPEWLIKTRPEYVVAYRRILAGEDPNLEPEAEMNLVHFTPEYLFHRWFYGSFQLFVGDLRIFRIRK